MIQWLILGILVALMATLIYLGVFIVQLKRAGGPRALQADIRRRLGK